MRLNLSGWYKGIIGLDDKVLDFGRMEIRPRITEQDLQRYYEECLRKLGNYSQYFEDQEAFQKTMDELLDSKRAKLVAKDSPSLFFETGHYIKSLMLYMLLKKPLKEGKYTHTEGNFVPIPLGDGSPFAELIDAEVIDNSSDLKKGRSSEEYKAIIQVVNDRTQPITKDNTIHGTLHYFIINYQLNSRRLLTKDLKVKSWIAERSMLEAVVEELTDLLLEDDKDALFKSRWVKYTYDNCYKVNLLRIGTALPFLLIGLGIVINPILLPVAIVSGVAGKIAYSRFKKSKREELTKPVERIEFKI